MTVFDPTNRRPLGLDARGLANLSTQAVLSIATALLVIYELALSLSVESPHLPEIVAGTTAAALSAFGVGWLESCRAHRDTTSRRIRAGLAGQGQRVAIASLRPNRLFDLGRRVGVSMGVTAQATALVAAFVPQPDAVSARVFAVLGIVTSGLVLITGTQMPPIESQPVH